MHSKSRISKVVVTLNSSLLSSKKLYVSRLPTGAGGVDYHQTVVLTRDSLDVSTLSSSKLNGDKIDPRCTQTCLKPYHFQDQRESVLKYNQHWSHQHLGTVKYLTCKKGPHFICNISLTTYVRYNMIRYIWSVLYMIYHICYIWNQI